MGSEQPKVTSPSEEFRKVRRMASSGAYFVDSAEGGWAAATSLKGFAKRAKELNAYVRGAGSIGMKGTVYRGKAKGDLDEALVEHVQMDDGKLLVTFKRLNKKEQPDTKSKTGGKFHHAEFLDENKKLRSLTFRVVNHGTSDEAPTIEVIDWTSKGADEAPE